MNRILQFSLIFIFTSSSVFANKLDDAFEALKIFDYFKAKSIFEDILEDEPVAAPYGLSIIYFRKDNPFHDYDKAYSFIIKAEVNFGDLREKHREALKKYDVNETSIYFHKNKIIETQWLNLKGVKNIPELNAFINKYPEFKDYDKVVEYRNNIAFNYADSVASYRSYREFSSTYPNDYRANDAKDKYEQLLYFEKTKSGTLQSYIDFLHVYPESKFAKEVQNKIYTLSTKSKTLKSYRFFIDNFPENINMKSAWYNLYTLSFTNFSDEEINDFKEKNSDFPYQSILSDISKTRDLVLYKVKANNKWGFINGSGEIEISPKYNYVNDFKNNLAIAKLNGKFGYINKKGKTIIDFNFDDGNDFEQGVAIVIKDDKYGLINKLGNTVLDLIYSHISNPKNGIVIAELESGKFIYFNLFGENIFDQEFDDAYSFKGDYAIVSKNKKYGVINKSGKVIIPHNSTSISSNNENKFIVENQENKFGLISLPKNDTIIKFENDNIGAFSEGKYAVFIKDKYFYVDEKGVKISEKLFNRYKGDVIKTKYKDGFSITSYRNKYGIIDSLTNKVFPNIFENIGDITDFPIPCSKRGKWGYVTSEIKLWIPYKYNYTGAFINNLAIVEKDNKYGVINKSDKFIIEKKFDLITRIKTNYFIVKLDNKYGIIDNKGEVVLKLEYNDIEKYNNEYILIEKEGQYIYFDIEKHKYLYVGNIMKTSK